MSDIVSEGSLTRPRNGTLRYPRRRKRIKGSSIAIFVFLLMVALFMAIPLYVVVVTSFKPIE